MEDQPIQPNNLNKQEDQQIVDHKTLNHNSLYYNFIERYFTTYCSDIQYVYLHSNGLIIISARCQKFPSAPIKIQHILEPVLVKGKRKKGGTKVKPNSIILKIHCQNNEIVDILALVDGTIIEVNEQLCLQNINKQEGYCVIIQPSKKFNAQKLGLISINPYNHM